VSGSRFRHRCSRSDCSASCARPCLYSRRETLPIGHPRECPPSPTVSKKIARRFYFQSGGVYEGPVPTPTWLMTKQPCETASQRTWSTIALRQASPVAIRRSWLWRRKVAVPLPVIDLLFLHADAEANWLAQGDLNEVGVRSAVDLVPAAGHQPGCVRPAAGNAPATAFGPIGRGDAAGYVDASP
jgi:hypothetical protein